MRIAGQLDPHRPRIAQILQADSPVGKGQFGGIDVAEEGHAAGAAVRHPAQYPYPAEARLRHDRQMQGGDFLAVRNAREGYFFIERKDVPIEGCKTAVNGHVRTSWPDGSAPGRTFRFSLAGRENSPDRML